MHQARQGTGPPRHRPHLYILDEPTTGLHFHDVRKPLECVPHEPSIRATPSSSSSTPRGHQTADWVIDLGPEGGDGGGEIVAAGPPEEIAGVERSYTGRFS
ncbi:MAG: hypothetical protein R3D02_00380 [Hyphomicrobiales bacterium]